MHSKIEFERRLRNERHIERFVLAVWLCMFVIGPLLFGRLQHVLQNTFGFSYDASAAVAAIALLASWCFPPLPLFYLRARAGSHPCHPRHPRLKIPALPGPTPPGLQLP